MPYVFQSKRRSDGGAHARYRFQYTDFRGERRTATGTTGKSETEKLALKVQADQDAIRQGWRPAPKLSDVPRPFAELLKEYLAWGESQGGRGGRAWGATHARMRRSHLDWWQTRLAADLISDLLGPLPRVEKALRDIGGKGRSGKTIANRAEAISAFCDWCVSRGYLDEDPLKKLSAFDTSPRSRRHAMSSDEVRQFLDTCNAQRRLTYEVAFASGLRAGELRALSVDNLDRECGGLRL